MEYLTVPDNLAELFKRAFPDAAHKAVHAAITEGEAGEIFDAINKLGGGTNILGEHLNFNAAQNDAAKRFWSFYDEVYGSSK